jgi:YVTN family beta-propeller protein
MNDFERRLSDALKSSSESYRPSDPHAAKERFLHRLRRRRLVFYSAGAAVAGAAAALALVVLPDRVTPPPPEPLPPASEVEQPRPIDVGQRPSGVAFGDDVVWVANSGDGTVMVVDPATRMVTETIAVGGDPDDVAVGVGAAWASDSGAGTITRIPLPSSGEPVVAGDPIQVGAAGSTHMDVAPGAGALWIAKDDSLFRIDPATNQPQEIPGVVEAPSDVAVGEGSVYVLGTNEVVRLDPTTLTVTFRAPISPTVNQDIAFREGFVWIANGDAGEVTRLDPEAEGFADPIYVGGNFSGIAVDEAAVWVISGGASEVGVLTRISPDSLAVVEPRAELTGRPYDITLGAGAVWVANQSANTLTGLDPAALPDGGERDPGTREVAFVFGADGDIWAETMDGEAMPIVRTPEPERDPTLSPDGRYVAFERGPDDRRDVRVVVRDLRTDEERTIGAGPEGVSDSLFPNWAPAFGPDGRLAVARSHDDDVVSILTLEVGDDAIRELAEWPATAGAGPARDADGLEWDLDGTYLYYNAGPRLESLYQANADGDQQPFELIPGNHQQGARYVSPSVRADSSVHVVRICCEPTPSDLETEFGVIRFTEGGPTYEGIASLDALGLASGDFATGGTVEAAGTLTLLGSGDGRGWRRTVVASWLIATERSIWLLDADGDSILVSDAMGRLGRIDGLETAP